LKAKQDWIEKEKKNAALEAVKHVKDGFIVQTSYPDICLGVKKTIKITTLEEHPTLDLTIDGADQIDEELNLIKGMGGALAQEKIVAFASKELVIVADESKKVKVLGENNHPVPVEVLPFAASIVMRKMREISGKPVLREGTGKIGPVITDNGNVIIDVEFGLIRDPMKLERRLKEFPGVVETGLFINMAKLAFLGKRSGVEKLEK
jgi:ribose 5-phosphate isomerase A